MKAARSRTGLAPLLAAGLWLAAPQGDAVSPGPGNGLGNGPDSGPGNGLGNGPGSGPGSGPDNGPEPFAAAVRSYRAGDHAAALAIFRRLVEEAGEGATAELLHNYALAALRQRRPAEAEPAARRLRELDQTTHGATAAFLLGQAAFERANLAELAASLPDAEPGAWQNGVDQAAAALQHFQTAVRLRGAPGWPAALRNAERASRKLLDLRTKRDNAEQETKTEKAPEPKPPEPRSKTPPEELPPAVTRVPLAAEEVQKVLQRLREQEREKRLLRRVANRSNRVGERDW